jgi:O-antigen/teichoic acid export membrane protein
VSDLGKKTISGVLWSGIERLLVQGIQFILGIVLARLLLPSDYGLIGMLTIFFSISLAIVDSGFSQALIQRKNVTQTDYSTVFYFNLFTSLCIYAALYFASPYIAAFFEEPRLTLITRVISLSILFNALSIIQIAKLTKALDFKSQTKCSVIAIVLSGILGIYLAFMGYGVWALVIQMVSKSILNLVLLMFFSLWWPSYVFSKSSLKSLFSFGSKLLASGLLNAVFNNLYFVVIGKFFSTKELGLYTRANQFQLLPSETLAVILQRVTLPVLSGIQDDTVRLVHYYRKFIRFTALVTFPLMLGLAVLAAPLVSVVLTDTWIESVPYLRLLAFVGLLYPIHALNLNLLKVLGRTDLFLKLEIYKKIAIVITLIITYRFGMIALVAGQVLLSFLFLYVNTFYTGKLIGYGIMQQLRDITPYLLIAALMGVIVMGFGTISIVPLYRLLGGSLVGMIVYTLLIYVFKRADYNEIVRIATLKLK